MRLRHMVIALLVVATCRAADARPPAATQSSLEAPAPTETRVYEVSDLVRPHAGSTGEAGRGFSSASGPNPFVGEPGAAPGAEMGVMSGTSGRAQRNPDLSDGLIQLLEETVDPLGWREAGGETGAIREFSGQLIITQTRENHQLIEKLLTEMRGQQAPMQMVCVRAYWIMLMPQDITAVFGESRKQGPGPLPVVPDAMCTGDKLYCQGQTICFSGQTVRISSGRQWSVVTDVAPVVGSNAVGYDPTVATTTSGVSLQITPQLVPGSESTLLDVRSTVTETRGPARSIGIGKPSTTRPVDDGAVEAVSAIDRVNVVNQELATSLRLPMGKKVLVGGMTLEPASKTDPGRQLYLVIELDAVK